MAHRAFRRFTLVIPLDLAFERHPAVLDDGADVLRGERQPCLDRGDDVARDIGIRPFGATRQPNLEIVRQPEDARDTLRRGFGLEFLGIAFDKAGEGDDAVVDGHPDISGIDIRVEAQLFLDVALDITVRFHRTSSVVSGTPLCKIAALTTRQPRRLTLPRPGLDNPATIPPLP